MSKEFIWNLDMDGEKCLFKVVVHDTEIVTYEGEEETAHIQITNPECKQGVLQIDTVTTLYGQKCAIQLEKGVPYIKPGKQWLMSATTYEARKQKLMYTYKVGAIVSVAVCILACLAVLVKYLVTGSMGSWWFLMVVGTFIAGTGLLQYYGTKSQMKELEEAEAEGKA